MTAVTPGERSGVSQLPVRLERLRDRITSVGGDPARITIVAVTKGFGPEAVAAAIDAGLPDIGENYAQELLDKAAALGPAAEGVRWHFVGRLQRNKVRLVSDRVALWHTLDRAQLVAEVARRSPGARVLVQVNTTAEPQKGGCAPPGAAQLVGSARDLGLDVRGLMTVGPAAGDSRTAFRTLRELADELALPERSMGMSDDLEDAVREGTTMVRIGRALFGERPS